MEHILIKKVRNRMLFLIAFKLCRNQSIIYSNKDNSRKLHSKKYSVKFDLYSCVKSVFTSSYVLSDTELEEWLIGISVN